MGGFIFYKGASQIDGSPVVGIATFETMSIQLLHPARVPTRPSVAIVAIAASMTSTAIALLERVLATSC
jgi:hypothetical protein